MKADDIIHHCYFEVTGNEPTQRLIKEIKENLPSGVLIAADQWGWNDTDVRGEIFRWIQKHSDSLNKF
jgi:hypothetical protein